MKWIDTNTIITICNVAITFTQFFFWRHISRYKSYESEKGKNVATKEDIGEITHKIENVKSLLTIQTTLKVQLLNKQKEAIEAVNDNNVCIITGGPGTGKTTIIKVILELYKSKKRKTVLCAPTGRAAKRMTETTGEEAKTLHRLLEIGKIEEERTSKYNDFDVAPLDADVIIVDELSMVDMFLMNYLLKCIYKGTKLILVGDSDQLASVGPGSVLKDLISSEKITTIHLDKIFRQAAKSKIILNAHRVNSGEEFLSKEEQEGLNQDFFFIEEQNQQKTAKSMYLIFGAHFLT